MIEPRLFVCGGAALAGWEELTEDRRVVHLNSAGPKPNVKVRFENVAKVFLKHLSDRLLDLLEIASYVYSADCATARGEAWTDGDSTEPWGRDLSFLIAVRDCDFWRQSAIRGSLSQVLGFLADDKYAFTFVPMQQEQNHQQYLDFAEREDWLFRDPDRVCMFSGGLVGRFALVRVGRSPVSTAVRDLPRSLAASR